MIHDGQIVHGIEVLVEELRQRRLFIATPMARGDCKGAYAASLARLFYTLGQWRIPFEYRYLADEADIVRGRNRLAVEFLNSECTNMLLVDADIGFNDGDVLVMMSANKDFVAAAYPLRRINWEKVREAVIARPTLHVDELQKIAMSDFALNYGDDFDPEKLSRVPEVAGGFNLLSRKVFQNLMGRSLSQYAKPLGYHVKKGEPSHQGFGWNFFGSGVDEDTHYYEPEDYSFCKRWRDVGGEIWLCPWIQLTHVGEMNFTGSMKYAFLKGGQFNRMRKVG